jgi:hypothetical protein
MINVFLCFKMFDNVENNRCGKKLYHPFCSSKSSLFLSGDGLYDLLPSFRIFVLSIALNKEEEEDGLCVLDASAFIHLKAAQPYPYTNSQTEKTRMRKYASIHSSSVAGK